MPEPTALPQKCEIHGCKLEIFTGAWGLSAMHPTPYCPQCGAEELDRAKAEDIARSERERMEALRQRAQDALEKRIGAAGIPERFRDHTFDTFPGKTDAARAACSRMRSYAVHWKDVRKGGVSVLVLGGVGTGKTGLACAVANRIMREDAATVLFISAYGAVRHQRDTWGRRGRTEREALDDLIAPDLLVLEEVGASVGSDAEMQMLFAVIDGRYAARRPTIILSNLPMEDFTDAAGARKAGLRTFLGSRIIDRFRDDGSFVLTCDWPSLRGARA